MNNFSGLKAQVAKSKIEYLISLSKKYGFKLYDGTAQSQREVNELYLSRLSRLTREFPDEVLINKYFQVIKECDFGFYLSVLKTLKTNHFGFNKFSALMETAEAIGKDLKQKGIKKINLTFLFTNSPIKGMDKFMETLPQKSRVDISKFELNNQVFYLLIDDFARSGSKSVYKTFEKFIGDDLISVSYYRHESFKEALNKCFNNSSLNVKGYPMSMYFERYKILYNNQTAFTQYAYSESIDGRYWKGWLTKNGFKSLGCELVNCEELVLVNGFNVPVKESRRLTIRKGQGTYTLYFDKDIDGGKFSEPKLLLAEVGSVHQYMIGTENIKNHLKK